MLRDEPTRPGRDRDVAPAGDRLGEGLERPVPGDLHDGADHPQDARVEVDRVVHEPGDLAPPEPAAGGGGDERAVALGDLGEQDLTQRRPADDLLVGVGLAPLRDPDVERGVEGDQPVADRGAQHRRGQPVGLGDGGPGALCPRSVTQACTDR